MIIGRFSFGITPEQLEDLIKDLTSGDINDAKRASMQLVAYTRKGGQKRKDLLQPYYTRAFEYCLARNGAPDTFWAHLWIESMNIRGDIKFPYTGDKTWVEFMEKPPEGINFEDTLALYPELWVRGTTRRL